MTGSELTATGKSSAKITLVELTLLSFFLCSDECLEEIRLMHLKLLLQEGPKCSLPESFSNQCTWNKEITKEHSMFKSFLTSIVGRDFQTRRKTFQAIFDKCDEWESQSWKYVLLLLRMVVDTGECGELEQDERNDFRAMAKSKPKQIQFKTI